MAFVGIAMAVGVGVALASNKAATPVRATGEEWASTTDTFERVSSLSSGDKVIIVAANYAKAMGAQGTNLRNTAAITKNQAGTELTVNTASTVALFTVGETTFSEDPVFTFHDGSGYLNDNSQTKSGNNQNYLTTVSDLDTESGKTHWAVTFSNGVASIVAKGQRVGTGRYTMSYNYNNGSDRFSCYTGIQGTGQLSIFRKVESSAEVDTVAASIKSGTYYTGTALSASDFNVTVTWTGGKADTHPTEGFTWTVNGVANGTLSEGNNSVILTFGGVPSDAFNVVGTTIHATGVSITEATASVAIGRTITLHGSVTPANAVETISWSSNKEGVATVNSSGVVTGVAEGSATITATANGYTDTCTVSVITAPDVEIGGTTLRNVNSYADSSTDVTVNGITFAYTQIMTTAANTGKMQIAKSNNGFWNTSALGRFIKAVEVSVDTNDVNVYFGTSIMTSSAGTAYNVSDDDGVKTVTPASNTYQYLRIETGNSYAKVNYVNIWYAPFVPSVELEEDSFTFTETTEGYIENDVTTSHFSGAVEFSFESSDSDVLDANDIIEDDGTITIAKSDIAPGETTVTVTATYLSESASADFAITCNAATRNLLSIAITTASSDTELEKGGKFTITDLVVTGTFDAVPLTADVTEECTFTIDDKEYTPGTTTLTAAGTFTVEVSHSDLPLAEPKTYSITVFESAKLTLTPALNGDSFTYSDTKTPSIDVDLNGGLSSSFDMETYGLSKQDSNMQMNPTKGTYIKNTTAVPGEILRIEMDWTGNNPGTNATPSIYFSDSYMASKPASGGTTATASASNTVTAASGKYYFFLDGTTLGAWTQLTELRIIYKETIQGPTKNFADEYLHMNTYSENLGYCNDISNHYYLTAKAAYNDLTSDQQTAFASLTSAKARYEAWAVANNDKAPYDGNDEVVTKIHAAGSAAFGNQSVDSNLPLIITFVTIGTVAAAGGFFFIQHKRRSED